MTGLLINGSLHEVPGLTIVPPAGYGGPERCQLGTEDYRMRPGTWVSKVVAHSTSGNWPQAIKPGKGPGGHALRVFDMWRGKDGGGGHHVCSGAHIVVDDDGTIFCAADLVRIMSYHATSVNPTSVGIEMCTAADGSIFEAVVDATARLIAALTWSDTPGCGLLPIPFQMPRGPYRNQPLRRLEINGEGLPGNDLVGVIGHRDQTGRRGYGDPGEEIWKRLAALGCEGIDYDGKEDILLGKERQAYLNSRGARLTVDGICGPASITAMASFGYKRWRDVGMAERAA